MDDCLISNTDVFWEDGIIELNYGKMKFTHSEDIERIAIVGEMKWRDWMQSVMKPFSEATIRYFSLAEKEQAMKWIINQEAVV